MSDKMNLPKYSTIVRLNIDKTDGTYYVALHPELEGCFSDGETPEDALTNLEEVTRMLLDHLQEHQLPIPSPKPLFVNPQELDQHRALPTKDTRVETPTLETYPVPA